MTTQMDGATLIRLTCRRRGRERRCVAKNEVPWEYRFCEPKAWDAAVAGSRIPHFRLF